MPSRSLATPPALGTQPPVLKRSLSTPFLLVIALILAFVSDASSLGDGAVIRITTWNLEWFPNGSPKRIPAEEQAKRIAAAAEFFDRSTLTFFSFKKFRITMRAHD